MEIRHAILMVTYNHEKFIRQALDSIFLNEILPDVVYLSDDCSTDNTYNIVLEYKKRYPYILICERNEKNIGLYANINKAWEFGRNCDCDIISWCSGDDYLKRGLLNELNRAIKENFINIYKDKFIIVTNSQELSNNKIKIIKNFKYRNSSVIKQRIRQNISYREVGISKNLIKIVDPLRDDLGLWSDLIFCLDLETKCEKFIFINFTGSCYRKHVGITSKVNIKDIYISKLKVNNEVLNKFNLYLSYQDKLYILLENKYYLLMLNYNIKNYILYIKYLLLNIFNIKYIKISYIRALLPFKLSALKIILDKKNKYSKI